MIGAAQAEQVAVDGVARHREARVILHTHAAACSANDSLTQKVTSERTNRQTDKEGAKPAGAAAY
jgi:hypothetical protein